MRYLLIIILGCSLASAQQMLQSISNNQYGASGGTVTLGQTTGTSANSGNNNTAIWVAFTTPTGASGYTLSSLKVNVNAAAGNLITNIYTSRSTTCPTTTGAGLCPNTQKCTTSASTAAGTGDNTINPTSCGTFAASTTYWIAANSNNASLAYNQAVSSFCGTTQFSDMFHSIGSFTLPATAATFGAGEQESGCMRFSVVLTCVGACGSTTPPLTIFTPSGTNAATVTTTTLAADFNCKNGTIAGTLTSQTTYSNTQTHNFPTSPICNGSSIAGSTMSIQRTVTSTNVWTYTFANALASTATLFQWVYNTSNTIANGDQFDLIEIGGGNSITFGAYGGTHCVGTTNPCFAVELSGGSGGTKFFGAWHYSVATWYAIGLLHNGGTAGSGIHQGAVFDTTGTELTSTDGSNLCGDAKTACINADSATKAANVRPLCDGSCASSAGTWYYGPMVIDQTGANWLTLGSTYGQVIEPNGIFKDGEYVAATNQDQMFWPDGPAVIGPVLSKLVHEGVIPYAELIDGHWYSFAVNRYVN